MAGIVSPRRSLTIGGPFEPTLPSGSAALITFDAKLDPAIHTGCYTNTATITGYAEHEGGGNFVPSFGSPLTDTAKVCVRATPTKSIATTSEAHTSDTTADTAANPRPLAIGEIVRYRVKVVLPEGASSAVKVTDALPPGLSYLNDSTARAALVDSAGTGLSASNFPCPLSNGSVLLVHTAPAPTGGTFDCVSPGTAPTWDLGTVANADSDSDVEAFVLEFNAIVCNTAGNVNGVLLPNTVSVSVDGTTDSTSVPVYSKVVEPKLSITKIGIPGVGPAGPVVNWTVPVTNSGSSDAFDAVITDLPGNGANTSGSTIQLLLPSPAISPAGIAAGCVFSTLTTATWVVTCPRIPTSTTVTITYRTTVQPTLATGSTTCYNPVTNQANATWTSLPGPAGTASNPTGSSTPGASGDVNGERGPAGSAGAVDNYVRQLTATVQPPYSVSAGCSSWSRPRAARCWPLQPLPATPTSRSRAWTTAHPVTRSRSARAPTRRRRLWPRSALRAPPAPGSRSRRL